MHRCCVWAMWVACMAPTLLAGCRTIDQQTAGAAVLVVPPQSNAPRELAKVMMPRYVIEPPDILTIDAIRSIPKSPYRLRATDVLNIRVQGTPPEKAPINGQYPVDLRGPSILDRRMAVEIGGLSVEASQRGRAPPFARRTWLSQPISFVGGLWGQPADRRPTPGRQDGTVTLGSYGSIVVAGLTLADAKATINATSRSSSTAPKSSVNVLRTTARCITSSHRGLAWATTSCAFLSLATIRSSTPLRR